MRYTVEWNCGGCEMAHYVNVESNMDNIAESSLIAVVLDITERIPTENLNSVVIKEYVGVVDTVDITMQVAEKIADIAMGVVFDSLFGREGRN
jgi:hypothetical protein